MCCNPNYTCWQKKVINVLLESNICLPCTTLVWPASYTPITKARNKLVAVTESFCVKLEPGVVSEYLLLFDSYWVSKREVYLLWSTISNFCLNQFNTRTDLLQGCKKMGTVEGRFRTDWQILILWVKFKAQRIN